MPHPDSGRNFEFDSDSGFAWQAEVVGDADSHIDPGFGSDPHADPHPDADFVGDAAPTLDSDSDSDADAGNEPDPDENLYRDADVNAYGAPTVDASAVPAQSEPGRNLGCARLCPGSQTPVGVAGRGIPRNSGRPHLGRPAPSAASA